ncbi:MAG: glycosyltransferase, partial [Bdellovibrionales bacterium]|nr:glycosyltransferase [Bdellovibrionales bacterium]
NNRCAERAQSDILVFLNNDTEPTRGWLEPLLEALQDDHVGACGPKLVYVESGKINHVGYVFNQELGTFYPIYHNAPADLPAVNKRRDYPALLGACLAIKKKVFFEVGMFESFGLEDIDLCLKIGQHGFGILYVPESCVLHHGSVTLRNSEPGTIPEMNSDEFTKRWLMGGLPWDDKIYYERDGYVCKGVIDGKMQIVTREQYCFEETEQAAEAFQAGRFAEARRHARNAARADSSHEQSRQILLSACVELGDLSTALDVAGDLHELRPADLQLRLIAAKLHILLGDARMARLVLAELEQLPAIDAAVQQQLLALKAEIESMPEKT